MQSIGSNIKCTRIHWQNSFGDTSSMHILIHQHGEFFCTCHTPNHYRKTITKYQQLATDTVPKYVWKKAFGKEFGNLAQGDVANNIDGADSIFVISHNEKENIPQDRVVTYTRVVVDYQPQKKTPIEYEWHKKEINLIPWWTQHSH